MLELNNYIEKNSDDKESSVTEIVTNKIHKNINEFEKIEKISSSTELYSKSIEYLKNLNIVTLKFLQNINYTKELNYLQQINLDIPQELDLMIKDLIEYSKLLDISHNNKRIFPQNFRLLEKFIKIDQISDVAQKQEMLKKKIIFQMNNIFNLINFSGVKYD